MSRQYNPAYATYQKPEYSHFAQRNSMRLAGRESVRFLKLLTKIVRHDDFSVVATYAR